MVWGKAVLVAATAGGNAFFKICFLNTAKLLGYDFVGEICPLYFKVKGITNGDFCLGKDLLKVCH